MNKSQVEQVVRSLHQIVNAELSLTVEQRQQREEVARAELNRRVDLRKSSLEVRAEQACAAAVGKTWTIRKDKNVSYTGVIVAACVKKMTTRQAGRSVAVEALMEIVLECGVAKARHSFLVNTLPR